eukprot:7083085-Prymnesium_polylepis.1
MWERCTVQPAGWHGAATGTNMPAVAPACVWCSLSLPPSTSRWPLFGRRGAQRERSRALRGIARISGPKELCGAGERAKMPHAIDRPLSRSWSLSKVSEGQRCSTVYATHVTAVCVMLTEVAPRRLTGAQDRSSRQPAHRGAGVDENMAESHAICAQRGAQRTVG